MKKIICLLAVILLLASGCRRASHNGKLDGFWRVETVEYLNAASGDSVAHPQNRFICIDLELFQLQEHGGIQATGVMDYSKGKHLLKVDFPYFEAGGSPLLERFGIMENPVTFLVSASGEKLVLSSTSTVVRCRRF